MKLLSIFLITSIAYSSCESDEYSDEDNVARTFGGFGNGWGGFGGNNWGGGGGGIGGGFGGGGLGATAYGAGWASQTALAPGDPCYIRSNCLSDNSNMGMGIFGGHAWRKCASSYREIWRCSRGCVAANESIPHGTCTNGKCACY